MQKQYLACKRNHNQSTSSHQRVNMSFSRMNVGSPDQRGGGKFKTKIQGVKK